MKVFYSEEHRKHEPPFEIMDGGLRSPYMENADRADQVLKALKKVKWMEILEPKDFGLDPIYAVHHKDYIDFLESCWDKWMDSEAKDKTVMLPSTFALRRHPQKPHSLLGRAGYYVMDLSACIVEGTYPAALAAANCALSTAEAVTNGDRAAFALCRPPGHHAGKDYSAGYCFINNASVAANWLSSKGKVAILDIDYHAGNGTQDIFYERGDVLSISIHADPDFEYPHFIGFANERGEGKGYGLHYNFPLPAQTNDENYLKTLDQALGIIRTFQPDYLVISAGMDIYRADKLGTFKITQKGIAEIGKRIAALDIPTVIVMEGGYANDVLGKNILHLLEPLK
jgi:acetoin utilization deacetylase AcuC-like enzyme